jgi:hypothetical protein
MLAALDIYPALNHNFADIHPIENSIELIKNFFKQEAISFSSVIQFQSKALTGFSLVNPQNVFNSSARALKNGSSLFGS